VPAFTVRGIARPLFVVEGEGEGEAARDAEGLGEPEGLAEPEGEEHRTETQLGSLLHRGQDVLVLLAGDRDGDVLARGRDLRLGDTERVDALTDDPDRLVEGVLGDRAGLAGRDAWLEDHARPTLEVETESRLVLVGRRDGLRADPVGCDVVDQCEHERGQHREDRDAAPRARRGLGSCHVWVSSFSRSGTPRLGAPGGG
jgi:hypothetical protein